MLRAVQSSTYLDYLTQDFDLRNICTIRTQISCLVSYEQSVFIIELHTMNMQSDFVALKDQPK